jgi:hypothetical protein
MGGLLARFMDPAELGSICIASDCIGPATAPALPEKRANLSQRGATPKHRK